jgi:hypothetical protein
MLRASVSRVTNPYGRAERSAICMFGDLPAGRLLTKRATCGGCAALPLAGSNSPCRVPGTFPGP